MDPSNTFRSQYNENQNTLAQFKSELQSYNTITQSINTSLTIIHNNITSIQSSIYPIQRYIQPYIVSSKILPYAIDDVQKLQQHMTYVDTYAEKYILQYNTQQQSNSNTTTLYRDIRHYIQCTSYIYIAYEYFLQHQQYNGIQDYIRRTDLLLKKSLNQLATQYNTLIQRYSKPVDTSVVILSSSSASSSSALPLSLLQIPHTILALLYGIATILTTCNHSAHIQAHCLVRSQIMKQGFKKIYYERLNQDNTNTGSSSTNLSTSLSLNSSGSSGSLGWQSYPRQHPSTAVLYIQTFISLSSLEYALIQRIFTQRSGSGGGGNESYVNDEDDDFQFELLPTSKFDSSSLLSNVFADLLENSTNNQTSPVASFLKKMEQTLNKLKNETIQIRIFMLLDTVKGMYKQFTTALKPMLHRRAEVYMKFAKFIDTVSQMLYKSFDEYKDQYIYITLENEVKAKKQTSGGSNAMIVCATVVDTLSYVRRLWEYSNTINQFASNLPLIDMSGIDNSTRKQRLGAAFSASSHPASPRSTSRNSDTSLSRQNTGADRSLLPDLPVSTSLSSMTDTSSLTIILIASLENSIRSVARKQFSNTSQEPLSALLILNNMNTIYKSVQRFDSEVGLAGSVEAVGSPRNQRRARNKSIAVLMKHVNQESSNTKANAAVTAMNDIAMNKESLAYTTSALSNHYTNRLQDARKQYFTVTWKKVLDVLSVSEISPAVLSAVADISSPPTTHASGEKLSVDVANESGTTALIYAVKNRRLNTVKQLIEEFYATIDIKDSEGKTALDYAVALRYDEIVSYLKQQAQLRISSGYRSPSLGSTDISINPNPHAANSIHITNKQVRQLLKNKFTSFNDMIENIYTQQRAYIVPDEDLRNGLRDEAENSVAVKYNKLYTIGSQVDFSKTPEKYIKYKPDAVRGMIQQLYQGV